jgi:dihydrofolate reductase
MRKVILLMHVSLDGFTAGPNGEMDWILLEDEIFKDVTDELNTVDTSLYGRVTYQMMESYWPSVQADPASTEREIAHAHWVEHVHKIVFSKSLSNVEWNNTRLIKDNIAEEITKLKQQPGKNMMIFGSPSLAHTFMQMDLIDEYQITVNPVVLGRGIPLFKDIRNSMNLRLLKTKIYHSGVVGLHYQTVRK